MKCPSCKTGELFLYKETETTYKIKLNKDNTISKRRVTSLEFDTSKDYLECGNGDCAEMFDYELNDRGRIIKDSVIER